MNMLNEMVFLTNNALDRDNWDAVKAASLPMGADDDPLTEQEASLLTEDQSAVTGISCADLMIGHTVLYQGAKYLAPCVEFHFRDDVTRHMWGSPAEPETNLPGRDTQLCAANQALGRLAKLQQLGILSALERDAEPTKDRHVLWILVPMDWALVRFSTVDDYRRYMRQVLSQR